MAVNLFSVFGQPFLRINAPLEEKYQNHQDYPERQ